MKWFYAFLACTPIATFALYGLDKGLTGPDLADFILVKLGGLGIIIIAALGIGLGVILGMTLIAHAGKGACDEAEKMFGDF